MTPLINCYKLKGIKENFLHIEAETLEKTLNPFQHQRCCSEADPLIVSQSPH